MKNLKSYAAGLLLLLAVSSALPAAKNTNYMQKANSAIEKGDYESAVSYLEKAYVSGNNECLMLLGEFYSFGYGVAQDLYVGLSYYEEALDYYTRIKAGDDVFYTLYNFLGKVHENLGEYTSALDYYQQGFDKAKDFYGEGSIQAADCCTYIGGIYYVWGDYQQALYWNEKALGLALKKDSGKNETAASCYNGIANIYSNQNKVDEAFDFYNKSVEIWKRLYGEESEDVATGYYNISSFSLDIGRYDDALLYANKALKIQQKILGDYYSDTAVTYNLLASVYEAKKDYSKALENYETALDILTCIYGDYQVELADTYYNLGFLYYDMKKYEDAIDCLETAFDSYEFSEDYNHVMENAWNAYLELDDVPENYKDDFFELKLLALTTGIDAAENMRNTISGKKENITVKALPLYYAAVDLYADSYEEKNSFYYSELLRSRGFLDEIGTEAALKLDGITDEDRELFNQYSDEIKQWNKKLAAENSKSKSERKQSDADRYNENLTAARKKLAELDEVLSKKVPKYAQLRNPVPVSYDEAKKWCGKDKVILEYAIWNEDYAASIADSGISKIDTESENPTVQKETSSGINSYCLVITNKKVIPVKLDEKYDYAAASEKMRNLITERRDYSDSDLQQCRKEIYGKIIEPVISEIPSSAKNILIVPDGALSFIPFDILAGNEGADFGELYNISMSPSVSVSMMTELNTASSGRKILALGNAVYDLNDGNSEDRGFQKKILASPKKSQIPSEVLLKQYAENDQAGKYYETKGISWTNLPGTGTEIHNIRDNSFKNMPSVMFDLMEGNVVSEANVKKMSAEKKLKDYSVIHFACHGYFDSVYSQMSSLVLSEVSDGSKDKVQDGYLTLSETSLLDLDADFVNLSACQTGLAKLKKGDGMTGLTRSFLVAGADKVGVTLWSVDDEATCEFMTRMYSYISKNGYSYEKAYSTVKSEFRKSDRWNAPYYWAAFVLYE